MSNFKFGNRSKEYLYGSDERPPVHVEVAELCVRALKYSTVDFAIIDGHRSTEQQQAMFAKGRSTLDGVTKISDHQRALAIDVLPVVKDSRGNRLDAFDVSIPEVRIAWLEVYRAFMRAGFKLGLIIEFGLGYKLGKSEESRDWPHMSIKGRTPKDYSGMSILD